ncbi:MAG TPA: dihydrofolate reductase family protein [Rubrobacter sp.]|nr:dihydrofolate reductase family protein [Rubrobacter sp.]
MVKDEVKATGAVVTGRRTFELADDWGGDHHDGHPIFALTRREPGSETEQWPLITYATDVRTAMTEAKQAAGDKNVLVHGAGTAQLALAAGVLDELEIHLMPVLLGQGRSLLLFALRTNRQLPPFRPFFALRVSFRRLFILKSGWVTPTHARVSTTGLRSIEVDGYR